MTILSVTVVSAVQHEDQFNNVKMLIFFATNDVFFKTPACPICKELMWSRIRRSLYAENVLSLVNKPCRFKNYGCDAKIMELNEHEKENCLFKDVKCVSTACQDIVSMSNLLDHLKDLRKEHYNSPLEIIPGWRHCK